MNTLGVDCAEVFLTSFFQYEREYGLRLQPKKGNIEVNSVHALTSQFEPELFSRHDGVRGDAYRILETFLGNARLLEAKYYSFHGTTRAKKGARNPDNDDFPYMAGRLLEISDFCEERGITLCLENVEWSTYNRLGVFSRMAREIPRLKGVLDVKQARLSGVPYEDYLAEMGERIAYAHLSDITAEGKMCLPGRGIFDFDEMMKRLLDVGFDGALLIEAYAKDYEELGELKIAYDFLQELVYKYQK